MQILEATDHTAQQMILAAMATNETICGKLSDKKNLFDTHTANRFSRWCVLHFEKYNEPLSDSVEARLLEWKTSSSPSLDDVASMTELVDQVYEQAQQLPTLEYLIDLVRDYVNRASLTRSLESGLESLRSGDSVDGVVESLQSHKQIDLEPTWSNPADHPEIFERVFSADRDKPLIPYRGAVGDFLGSAFQRSRFFSFMAPDKSGKSFWLLDVAFRALRSGLRVAFIEAGDMGEDGVYERLGTRAARRPRWPTTVKKPVSIKVDDDGTPAVVFEDRIFEDRLSGASAHESFSRLLRGKDLFRLSSHPASTLTVNTLRSDLRCWATEDGWIADVVVVDYADILAKPSGLDDDLAGIDQVWMQLRGLAQELHCLLLTATQSSAMAYKLKKTSVLTKESFSGRKTKLAHVSGMLGINVSPEDKQQGITRLNWIVYRHGKFDERAVVHCAGCPDVADPVVVSQMIKYGGRGNESNTGTGAPSDSPTRIQNM